MPPKPDQKPPDDGTPHPEPKQFVRTFHSDSAAVQKGAAPGFNEVEPPPKPLPLPTPPTSSLATPTSTKKLEPLPPTPVFEESDLLQNESLIPPSLSHEDKGSFFPKISLTKEVPQEIPAFRAADLDLENEVLPEKPATPSALSRIVEGSIFPTFSLEKEPTASLLPPPPPVRKEEAPIHTYSSDFVDHVKTEEASTATILAAEQDARVEDTKTGTAFNIPLIIGGILFIVISGGGAYATYRYLNNEAPPPVQTITESIPPPIVADEREEIAGVGKALESALVASLAKPLAAGKIRMLYTAIATTTGNDVFSALKLGAPNILVRNIRTQGGMAGIAHASKTSTPFFILSVSSYSDTFAGMLAWEPTLGDDMAALFTPSATTTRPFRDEILGGHDVRVLRDVTGQSIVMYGYFDLSTLLIARDTDAYQELVKRLSKARTTK